MAKIVKEERQELTRAELEIMQVIWKKGKVLVHDILEEMPEPRPAYNTVSTIVRILESKGFVSHKAYGRTYEYFPLVAKEEYTGTYMRRTYEYFPLVAKEEYTGTYMRTVLDNFFDGSVSRMVNFFSSQKSISVEETDEILKILNSGK